MRLTRYAAAQGFLWAFMASVAIGLGGCLDFGKSGRAEVRHLDPMEAMGELRNGFAVLVDVRERHETLSGVAGPAAWFATSDILMNHAAWTQYLKTLPEDKTIIFYEGVTGESDRVARIIADQGFKTADMGEFSQWTTAGLPVRKP